MKSFVTGANGFIGKHLAKALVNQGNEVQAFVRRPNECQSLKDLGVTLIKGNLKDDKSVNKAIKDVDIIYHLGATTKGKIWQEHYKTTVLGTNHILNAAEKAKVQRVVYISTLGVYDLRNCRNGCSIDESWQIDNKLVQRGPYVYTKAKTENNVLQFYKDTGLPVTIIRPGLVYGPGSAVFFPHIGFKVGQKGVIVLGNGKNLIPFVYVDNLIDAIIAAGTKKTAIGKIYHIVDKEEITQADYLNQLMNATNWKPIKIHLPWSFLFAIIGLLELAAKVDPLGKIPKTSLHLYISKSKSVKYNTSLSQKDLDWEQKVSFNKGLAETFNWYRNNNQMV